MYKSLAIDEAPSADAHATLVILADGFLGKRIARLAQTHAAFDPDRRRVLQPGDALYPVADSLSPWRDRGAVALVINPFGEVCAVLDDQRATTAGSIETAFLSILRSPAF